MRNLPNNAKIGSSLKFLLTGYTVFYSCICDLYYYILIHTVNTGNDARIKGKVNHCAEIDHRLLFCTVYQSILNVMGKKDCEALTLCWKFVSNQKFSFFQWRYPPHLPKLDLWNFNKAEVEILPYVHVTY